MDFRELKAMLVLYVTSSEDTRRRAEELLPELRMFDAGNQLIRLTKVNEFVGAHITELHSTLAHIKDAKQLLDGEHPSIDEARNKLERAESRLETTIEFTRLLPGAGYVRSP